MKVYNEDLTDSKITLQQAVTYDSPEDDDRSVTNEEELFENFEKDLENVIADVVAHKNEIFDKEEAELIKNIELVELNDKYVKISVQLSKQLSTSQIKEHFSDLVEYLVGEMESQRVTVNVTNVYSTRWDYSRETTYEVKDDDYEDEEYVNLETKGEVQIIYDKFIKDESKKNEAIDFDKEISDLEDEIAEIEKKIQEIEEAMFNYRGDNEYVLMDYQDDIDNLIKEKEECLDEIDNLRKDKEKSLKTEEMNETTREFFDELEYESKYDRFFGRGIAKYIYDTYAGKDVKLLDSYIKSELEDGSLDLEDLRNWNKEWVDMKIKEARNYASKNEGIKEGIEKILNKLKDKISFKYQGNKKNKDGRNYDRYVCKIKKAGIFDLVGFEDELKNLGDKFGVSFKVTYPNDKQDHSVFWIEGRFKDQIVDKNGNKTAYESKQLKEDYSDDQKEFYKNMFDECCKESTIGHKRITIDVVDTESNCIESLLRYVQRVASQGHSFPIYVDNEGDWSYARFGFDGDGSDRIINIEVEEIKDEEGEE